MTNPRNLWHQVKALKASDSWDYLMVSSRLFPNMVSALEMNDEAFTRVTLNELEKVLNNLDHHCTCGCGGEE